MDEIVYRLLDFEKKFGKEILSDKTKLPALIKDYFPGAAKEQRMVAKGLELGIYKKIATASISEILQYKTQTIKELCEEHGANATFAEDVVDLWIRMIEKKRQIEIIKKKPQTKDAPKEAIEAYRKNMKTDRSAATTGAVVYEREKTSGIDLDAIENSITGDAWQKTSSRFRPGGQLVTRSGVKSSSSSTERLLHKAVKDAFDEFLDLAEENDPAAQGIIGMCYYAGKNVPQDYTEAVKWFRKAAAGGQAQSQNLLGYCYFHGFGVSQNYTLAAHWFTEAAQKGDSSAQTILGNCFFYGLGVYKDSKKAIQLYEMAAEQGFAGAQFTLGECYYLGEGVRKNKYTALKWFEKAAAQNHQQALLYLTELSEFKAQTQAKASNGVAVKNYYQSDRYAKKYTSDLFNTVKDEELLKKFIIHSDENDIAAFVSHKITGLGVKTDEDEYPLFILNTGEKSTVSMFSDYVLFTTKGVYISQPFRKRRFIFHADISSITAEEEEKKIQLNNFYISLAVMPEGSINLITDIMRNTAKNFK